MLIFNPKPEIKYYNIVIDGDDILDNSNKTQALAYVWSDKNDPSLYGEWDFEVNL